jgi:aspartyl-tRNA(Asn)/glutamyl-tRNA(Gln) amidotransferase subunit C|tara:strand:- start:606 stop:902 length:297 start_codon:yes stop_codon:yes gene_type:complete
MEINNKLIEEIASLAKLNFDENSKELMKSDLKKIISFINKLSEVDTSNVEPLVYLSDEVNVLREDEVKEVISQVDALKNAPQKDSDYFNIPKIIKKNN